MTLNCRNVCGPCLAWLLLAISLVCSGAVPAQAQTAQGAPLRVATRQVSPFVIKDKEVFSGFSIDLWDAVARQMNVRSEYADKATLAQLLASVKNGEADLAIAAISITSEREQAFDFSQPIFDSGLKIMTATDKSAGASIIASFLSIFTSRAFLELLTLLGILILLPVPVIWLLDKHRHDGVVHSASVIGQISRTLWWSGSTLAGQATHMPMSWGGRVFAMFWMFVSVVFVSYFTANVTANLTVKRLQSNISSTKDLAGKRVASVSGSTAAAYQTSLDLKPIAFVGIEDAFAALEKSEVQAIVYDAPILMYYAAHGGKGTTETAGAIFHPESYGILLPSGSPLRKRINEALLKLRESGEYQMLYRKWFVAEQRSDD